MTTVTVAVAPVPVPVAMVIRVIKCIDYDTVQYSVGLLLHTSAQFIRYEQYLRPHSIKVVAVAVAPVAVRTRGKVGRSKENSKARSQ